MWTNRDIKNTFKVRSLVIALLITSIQISFYRRSDRQCVYQYLTMLPSDLNICDFQSCLPYIEQAHNVPQYSPRVLQTPAAGIEHKTQSPGLPFSLLRPLVSASPSRHLWVSSGSTAFAGLRHYSLFKAGLLFSCLGFMCYRK